MRRAARATVRRTPVECGYNGRVSTIALDARLAFYRRDSGIGQYIVHLADWLPRLDPQRAYLVLHSRKDRVTLSRAPNARRRDLWTPSHHRFEQRALRFELARLRADLLHSPDFIPPFHGRFRRVITVHDLTFLRYPQFLTGESRRYYNDQIGRAVSAADHILADSHATRADLVELLGVPPGKVTVVWLAPDDRFRRLPLTEVRERLHRLGLPERYLLFVGTFEPRKNVAGLLSAYRLLHQRDPAGGPLVLAGERGWLFDETMDRIDRLGLRDSVICVDHPVDEDLVVLYNGAAALVLPSHYEGFGLPVLEAMRCGCPVIISHRGSLPEIAGGAAAVVDDPEDVDELVWVMEQMISDGAWRAGLRDKGFARAAEFSWERCALETRSVYERVLAES